MNLHRQRNMTRSSHPSDSNIHYGNTLLDEIQTTPPTTTKTNLRKPHTSLNINQISDDNLPKLTTSKQSKKTEILKYFYYIIIIPIGIVIFAALLSITSIALIPLLITALLVIRFMCVFKQGQEFYKIIELRFLIRLWLLFDTFFALLPLYILLVIVNHIPNLKNELILDFQRFKWLKLFCMMYGFYVLAFILNVVARYIVHPFPVEYQGSGLVVRESICEAINSMVFWWSKHELFKRVPYLGHHQILGLEIDEWISVILLLAIGNVIISIFTHMVVWLLMKLCQKIKPSKSIILKPSLLLTMLSQKAPVSSTRNKESGEKGGKALCTQLGFSSELFHRHGLVYWAKGVKWDVNFILTTSMLLLVWVFYICPRLSGVKHVLYVFTLSFATLLVFSFLYLIKTCLMKSWEARAVFCRFKENILRKKKNMYFVGMVGCTDHDLLLLGEVPVFAAKRDEIKQLLMEDDENLTMFDLQKIAQCLIIAKKTLLHEKSKVIIQDWWKNLHSQLDDPFNKHFKYLILEDSADTTIEGTTMENARDSCISLANMLSSEQDAYNCLNNIISGFIIVATILLWLLLTGFATIQLLVLSASPLLAATFIFGETLKNLFQGIIFVYAVNPFDIGDLCTIEGQLMEVKSVGVWRTTFTLIEKLGILEEIIHPNSELAKKTIINYKTEFDWDEFMEFNVGLLEEKHVKQLKKDIERHLNITKSNYVPNSHSVAILATGETVNIVVKFKYVKSVNGVGTYFACLQKKDKLRSEFSLHVHNLVLNLRKDQESTGPGAPLCTSTTMNDQPISGSGNWANLLNQGNNVATMETMGHAQADVGTGLLGSVQTL